MTSARRILFLQVLGRAGVRVRGVPIKAAIAALVADPSSTVFTRLPFPDVPSVDRLRVLQASAAGRGIIACSGSLMDEVRAAAPQFRAPVHETAGPLDQLVQPVSATA